MTTPALITSDERTKGQNKQLRRFIGDTLRLALDEVKGNGASQRLISHYGQFQAHVLEGVRRYSANQPYYANILGDDFITPEEVTRARPNIVYTGDQIAELANSIPSAKDLEWCKEHGYAVMPAPPTPMSLLDVRFLNSHHFYSQTGGWYANQEFAQNNKTSFGWLAVRKTPVPDSLSKTWEEQNRLLHQSERVPNAAEMSWFITTYFEVRRIRLFEKIYVRCSDLDSDGDRVDVGRFDSMGLGVDDCWDYGRGSRLGVSAARK